jgi:hypothetical protein
MYLREQRAVESVAQQYKPMQKFIQTSIEGWDYALFRKKIASGSPYRQQELFFYQVFTTANEIFPELIQWLKQSFSDLKTSDIVLICLLLSDITVTEICNIYPIWNRGSVDVHRHRLRQKLYIKTDSKGQRSSNDHLIDLYLQSKM